MKRVWLLSIALGWLVFAAGCPGGEEAPTPSQGAVAPAVNEQHGTPATTSRGTFKEGIDSGRAPDGSDEDK